MSKDLKNPMIVSYPDSDDENTVNYSRAGDPIGQGAGKYSFQQFTTSNTRNRGKQNRYSEGTGKNSSYHGNFSSNRTFSSQRKSAHITSKEEMIDFIVNLQKEDLKPDRMRSENSIKPNRYQSAEANWKKYKSEKAAEIVHPEQFESAEAGWKKIKSENKWSTTTWRGISGGQSIQERELSESSGSGKLYDMFQDESPDSLMLDKKQAWHHHEDRHEADRSWDNLYADGEDKRIVSHKNRGHNEGDEEFLFDEILSRSIDERSANKNVDMSTDFNFVAYDSDDSSYEQEILKSQKLLEESKRMFTLSDEQNSYEDYDARSDRRVERDAIYHTGEITDVRQVDIDVRNDRSKVFDIHNDRLDRDRIVEKEREEYNTKTNDAESYSSRPDIYRDGNDNHEMAGSKGEETDGWYRSITIKPKEKSEKNSTSPRRRNNSTSSSSSSDSHRSGSHSRSPGRKSPDKTDPEAIAVPVPTVVNPYDNPDLNITSIGKYFDDLMEWNYSHRCLICDKVFSNLKEWTGHILDTKHGREFHLDPYRCPPCHEVFRHKKDWKIHMAYSNSHGFMGSINVQKPGTLVPIDPRYPVQHGWRCKGCSAITQNRSDAYKHIKMVHLVHQAQYPCPLCGIPFWFQQDLDDHADQAHAPPKYTCKICNRAYESAQKLENHRLLKHQRKIFCYRCKKEVDELIFDEHTEMHRLNFKRKCHQCGRRFADQALLLKHIREYHSEKQRPKRHKSANNSYSDSENSVSSGNLDLSHEDQNDEVKNVPNANSEHKADKQQVNEEPVLNVWNNNSDSKAKHTAYDSESKIPSSQDASPYEHSESDIAPPGDEDYQRPVATAIVDDVKVAQDERMEKGGNVKAAGEEMAKKLDSKRERREERYSKSEDDRSSHSANKSSKSHTQYQKHSSYRRESQEYKESRSRSREYRRNSSQSHNKGSRYRSRSRSRDRSRHYKSRLDGRSRSRSPRKDYRKYDHGSSRHDRTRESRSSRDSRRSSKSERGRSVSRGHSLDDPIKEDFKIDKKELSVEKSENKSQLEERDDGFENKQHTENRSLIVKSYGKESEEKDAPQISSVVERDAAVSVIDSKDHIPLFDESVMPSTSNDNEEEKVRVDEHTNENVEEIPNVTWVVENQQVKQNSDSDSEDDKETQKINCKECGRTFKTLTNLRDHFMVKHKRNYSLKSKKPPPTSMSKLQVKKRKPTPLTQEQKEIAKLIEGIE